MLCTNGVRLLLLEAALPVRHQTAHGCKHSAAFCLGFLNHILHLRCPLKLMVYLDTLLVELKIGKGQPTELRDTQSCIEKNIDRIIVSAEMLIFLEKFQKLTLLLTGNCRHG